MKRLYKIFVALSIILCATNTLKAQTFGNEWINYGQQYAKFSLYQNGMYRISHAQLASAGLSNSNGATLQVFRDGQQVPIFVSTNGTFGAADFIEFYAEQANGKVDEALFIDPNKQMNKTQNLISDTAYFFVTQSNSGPYARYAQASNNITGSQVKEPYVWDVQNINFRNVLSQGPSYIGQSDNPIHYIQSSQFEEAEGWVNTFPSTSNLNINESFSMSNVYKGPGAPDVSLKTTVAGFSYLSLHKVKIEANSNFLAEETFPKFTAKEFNMSMPINMLTASNSVSLLYTPQNSQSSFNLYDRIGVSNINARYARTTNFNGFNEKYFELNAKSGSYYLELDDFSILGGAPRLYDLDANQYYNADISVPNKVRFLIPANTNLKRFYLVNLLPSSFKTVSKIESVTFKNYSNAANQGNYIIITHPYYYDGGNGANYVNDYKNFRSSASGGGYNSIVAEIDDLYNEFGYGYAFHSQAITNFLNYSHNSPLWSDKSRFAFLIGKGIFYSDYVTYSQTRQTNPSSFPYVPLPTFGIPASDIMLTDFSRDNTPELPIGRLSILNGRQVSPYLEKVKIHEARFLGNQQYVDSIFWMKQVLHIAGAEDLSQQAPILQALNRQGVMLKDIDFGGYVSTFAKSQTQAIQIEDTEEIKATLNKGTGFLQFFGHGSLGSLDFGGLDNPTDFKPNGKYSIFMANGCGVGAVFGLNGARSLSEQWIEVPDHGSVGFLANSNIGYLYYLANYTDSLYRQFSDYNYGKTIGEQIIANVANNFSYPNNFSNHVVRLHAEQILLQGDPAVSMFGLEKPDYAVEDKYFRIKQTSITTKADSFDVELVIYNLGKYVKDSMDVFVSRTMPNNITDVLIDKRYAGLASSDTLSFRVAVGGQEALGLNTFRIKIDNLDETDEMTESNNEISRSFLIYNDDLEPVYPYEFSIVNSQDVTLKASTLNPFIESRQYVFQIDTTEEFSSPSLQTKRIVSGGGVIKWRPAISYTDGRVYYWRTAMDTIYDNPTHRWSASSFIYLSNSSTGWNQSHYFQYKKDNYQSLILDSVQRNFNFTSLTRKLQVQNVVHGLPAPNSYNFSDYKVSVNGVQMYGFGCDAFPNYESLQFVVIDSATGLPWINTIDPNNTSYGRFWSHKPCRVQTFPGSGVYVDPFFEIYTANPIARQLIKDFIDSIPTGAYIMMQPRLCAGPDCGGVNTTFIDTWKSDTISQGSGNSLYHKIKNMGFTMIDSFYKNRPMAFFMQKGNLASVEQYVAPNVTDKLNAEFTFTSFLYEGKMLSNKIGPALKWSDFKRSGTTIDAGPGDTVAVEIYGIDKNNGEALLAKVYGDTSLSFIDANMYPNIRLVMNQQDNTYSTPEQVQYWRVHYSPVPEAALNPNAHLAFIDSMGQGQVSNVSVAIENLTDISMDSMLVKYSLLDANSDETELALKKYRPLLGNDTLHATIPFDSKALSGNYFFKIEANPNNDQPEQYHPNNIGFKALNVNADNQNPLLDVTFDGIHILNKDIVSAKPNILITLKDENQFLALDDTTSMELNLRYPDNSNVEVPISYGDPALTFIPADPNGAGENKARLEYRPTFTKDGVYELVVKGKDRMGNKSGNVDYRISFEVVTKSSITSVLNYPNPFSTQTQFVFTLTGAQVPEQFKIQVYSVTGKVVREISKAEIGPLHIGRNITDFRWKGDDQFGDMLGNGVYLYRVVTRLNGLEMDKAESDAAGKWTEKGFGKLYIMR